MIAYAKAEQPFKLAAEWFDWALAGLGVAMESSKNAQGGFLLNRADFGAHIRVKANLFHADSVTLVVADLVHREAAFGGNLLEGDAMAALPEILTRRSNGTAVFFSELIVFIVDHDLKQVDYGGQLARAELIEQLVSVLFGFYGIDRHCVLQTDIPAG